MAIVRQIKDRSQIPSAGSYVLIMYGNETKTIRHSRGYTTMIDVAHLYKGVPLTAVKEVEFAMSIHEGMELANSEDIEVVYVIDER